MVCCNFRDRAEARDGGKGHCRRFSSRQARQGAGIARGAACGVQTHARREGLHQLRPARVTRSARRPRVPRKLGIEG